MTATAERLDKRLTTLSREQLAAAVEQAAERYDLDPHERVVVAERLAREVARRNRRTRYATPGALAHKIDPLTTIETPALVAVDEALVRAVERMEAGEGNRLAVAMPPQEGKSRRCTIAFPLWLLVRNPELRIAIASFESDIASTFSREVRNWIVAHGSGSPARPRSLSDDLLGITLRGDSTSVSRFNIAGHQGSVIAVGMKGGLTSKAVDVLIVDDPYKNREQADSPEHRAKVWDWWTNVAVPRLPSAALVVLVQTRWHEDDLIGRIIGQERALPEHLRRWAFVNVPAQAERPRLDDEGKPVAGWLPDTLGRKPGTYLVSARGRTPEDWVLRRHEVGERAWGSLYQQHPTPPEGAIFAEAHITRTRRPVDWTTAASLRLVAVDPSAGGTDEAGLVAGYRGRDGRAYVTHDRSAQMTSARWAREAWLLAVDTGADEVVWETNLAAPTMRQELVNAWARIVAQVRTLDEAAARYAADAGLRARVRALNATRLDPVTRRPLIDLAPDAQLDREQILRSAAYVWAATEQRLPVEQVEVNPDDLRQLGEVLDRIEAGLLAGAMTTPPAKLVGVHASIGKRLRAQPVAVAVETGQVSHVGTLPELEQELTTWAEGQPSPGRLDAYVYLVTRALAARRSRSHTAAGETLPTAAR